MKYTKILAFGVLLFGMAAEGRAQVFQVFQKDGMTTKFQSVNVDSLSHNDADGLTTIHLKDGSKKTFHRAATDSVVWYDPTNSIFAKLQKKGNFTNFLRLVQESEWWTDMMNGATDLTVFAADDSHWRNFFAQNAKLPESDPWHKATSFEALSAGQRRLLLHSAIAGTDAGKDDYIRSLSKVTGLDMLQHLPASEVPVTYSPNEKWYWERFHETNGGNGLYLATDSCDRYNVILTPEKAKRLGITDLDYAILFPSAAKSIANAQDILRQDIATNGVIHSVAAPLMPLQSMAEIIRTNGRTNIFSHLLDRFSAPFYSPVLTGNYMQMNPEFTDSIFIKRYFSENNYSYLASYSDIPSLKFDPGWTGYYDELLPQRDMAAMFVPSDEAMWCYFTEGAGKSLLHVYYAQDGTANEIPYTSPATEEELLRQADCIPIDVIGSIINNMMMRSFVGSVPSKWSRLYNDAMEPMFPNTNDALAKLDTCLQGNNGMVYVMDNLSLPANLSSVAAPTYASNTCKIINSAIYGEYMYMSYYAYLNAHQDITFFLPSDEALRYYYDPISMKSRTPRVIKFKTQTATVPVVLDFYNYSCPYNKDVLKEEVGYAAQTDKNKITGKNAAQSPGEVINRLKDILFSHTIVNDGTQDIHSRNEYYRTLGGDVVKVVRDAGGNIVGAKGTFQMENERLGIETETPGVTECVVKDSYEALSNGQTYTLDAPLVPTYRSLWSLMTNDADKEGSIEGMGGETPYSEFYKLCTGAGYEDVIIGCGLVDGNLNPAQHQSALKKYKVFMADKGLDYNLSYLTGNTPYTAYIPTNEAVRRAIAQGLPTWDDIYEDFRSHCKPFIDEETGEPRVDYDGEIEYSDSLQTREDSVRIANKIRTLTNFVKAHFHFGMAIADKEPFQREYKSLWIDEQTLASPKVKVNCTGNGQMTVTDWKGKTVNVVGEEKNIFVRDHTCSSSPANVQMNGITKESCRPGVVHQIDGVLGFK